MKKNLPKKNARRPQETDERVARSKKAVLAATFQLMAESGFGGVSVDEVSRRSGVAKTTVYRHWPSRAALLIDACSTLHAKPQAPDTSSLKGDLIALVTHMAGRLRSDRWATILPSVIDAAERDAELAQVQTRIHGGFMEPLYTVLSRAQQRGELPRDCDLSEVVACVVGPLFYRRFFSRQPLDEKFVKTIVEHVAGKSKK